MTDKKEPIKSKAVNKKKAKPVECVVLQKTQHGGRLVKPDEIVFVDGKINEDVFKVVKK